MLISALNVIVAGNLVVIVSVSLHGAAQDMIAVACTPAPVLGGHRLGGVGFSR